MYRLFNMVREYLRTQTHNVVDIVINFNHRIKINGNGIKNPQKYIYWLELSYKKRVSIYIIYMYTHVIYGNAVKSYKSLSFMVIIR